MRRRSTKHHPNIAEIVQSAQHLELLEVSIFMGGIAVESFRPEFPVEGFNEDITL